MYETLKYGGPATVMKFQRESNYVVFRSQNPGTGSNPTRCTYIELRISIIMVRLINFLRFNYSCYITSHYFVTIGLKEKELCTEESILRSGRNSYRRRKSHEEHEREEKRDLTTTGNNIPATAERAAPSN